MFEHFKIIFLAEIKILRVQIESQQRKARLLENQTFAILNKTTALEKGKPNRCQKNSGLLLMLSLGNCNLSLEFTLLSLNYLNK